MMAKATQTPATIADVAALAGVGVGTVSRVVNNSGSVSVATRQQVEGAIAKLGYVPNATARALQRGKSHTIAVITHDVTSPSVIERLRGIQSVIGGSDYTMILINAPTPHDINDVVPTALAVHRPDGALTISLPVAVGAATSPLVSIDGQAPGAPSVVIDDIDGGRMAIGHLLGLGHRHIGYLADIPTAGMPYTSSDARYRGFCSAIAAAGLDPAAMPVARSTIDRVDAARSAENLLRTNPDLTAVFAHSDVQALGVLDAARELGLSVPRDLSVMGFDGIEVSEWAGLTTVRQPLFDSGKRGAELLLELLAGAPVAGSIHWLDLTVLDRATTGPVAGEPK